MTPPCSMLREKLPTRSGRILKRNSGQSWLSETTSMPSTRLNGILSISISCSAFSSCSSVAAFSIACLPFRKSFMHSTSSGPGGQPTERLSRDLVQGSVCERWHSAAAGMLKDQSFDLGDDERRARLTLAFGEFRRDAPDQLVDGLALALLDLRRDGGGERIDQSGGPYLDQAAGDQRVLYFGQEHVHRSHELVETGGILHVSHDFVDRCLEAPDRIQQHRLEKNGLGRVVVLDVAQTDSDLRRHTAHREAPETVAHENFMRCLHDFARSLEAALGSHGCLALQRIFFGLAHDPKNLS